MYSRLYGKEKRRSKRINYICEVECESDGVNRLNTRINDLSTTGVFIDSMTCFAVGSVLRMKFRLGDRQISALGEVRYAMPSVGMGLRFINLTPEDHAAIDAVVTGSGPLPRLPITSEDSQKQDQNPESLLSGSLRFVNIIDIIHIVDNSRLTGKLVIKSSAAEGEIYFNTGQLAGASADLQSGVEALDRFLAVTDGRFEFKQSTSEYSRTIQAPSNTALLIALLKARDEENRPVS
jgi:hypothetical protein